MPRTAHKGDGEDVSRDAPLRLDDAAGIAFPNGRMTASGLRREAKRGRLVIYRIAGKDFTTLNAIEAMIRRCPLPAKGPDCGSNQDAISG